jgi:hypothetical protein
MFLTLDLSPVAILTFSIGAGILVIYSISDIKSRSVPNWVIMLCTVGGLIVNVFSGQLINNWILHISSVAIFAIMGYILFRMGSIGGADAKAGISIGVVSPGFSLGSWASPVFEAMLVSCIELMIMIALGYAYSRMMRNTGEVTPLVPGLFIGYLLVQLLAIL